MLSAESKTRAVTPSGRISYARIDRKVDGVSYEKFEIPNLIELQLDSFAWFMEKGLRELFDEISPIKDFTGKVMELQFLDYEFGEPKYSEEECRTKDLTFSKPLYVNVELLIKETGEIQRQRVYMGDYPWMTDQGTFVINGAERVVVSQLVRSPGVYYSEAEDLASGRMLFSAKVIPNRGAWLEFETNNKDQLWVKVDRKRKIAATTLLRAVGYEAERRDRRAVRLDRHRPGAPVHREHARQGPHAHHRPRPSSRSTRSSARAIRPPVRTRASSSRACSSTSAATTSVGSVATSSTRSSTAWRRAWASSSRVSTRTISREDIAAIVGHLIECNRGLHPKDDIDHLGNRRIRANGELIQNAFRIGLLRMERVVRERMTIQEIDKATPNALINIRPVVAAMKEFFGGSQLSPVHGPDQPAGRADVQAPPVGPWSGRPVARARRASTSATCTTATTAGSARSRRPEGPNIGLIGSLATYGRINSYGFIETPYRKVKRTVAYDETGVDKFEAGQDLVSKSGAVVLKAGQPFTAAAISGAQEAEGARLPDPPGRHRRHRVPPRGRGGGARRRAGQRTARRGGPLHGRAHPVPLPGHVPRGPCQPDRIHGRVAQAGRLRGDRAHPVPRARRRQPRPHGLEHAAPGRAAPGAGVADRRHRHGGARRARLRPGPGLPPRAAWSRA